MSENTETTGGTRYSAGKPGGWWYGPIYGLRLVAEVWEGGADKYAPLDWKEGQSFSTLWDSLSRHWLEVNIRGPWSKDEESGAYHVAHLAWNALCMLTFMALGRDDLDDITPYHGVNASDLEQAKSEADAQDKDVLEVLREQEAELTVYSEPTDKETAKLVEEM